MKFRDEYYFLSNMYPCDITVWIHDGLHHFKCLESAYQAFKCPERYLDFVYLDGFKAKKLGKTVPLREDWEDIKISIMKSLIIVKFTSYPEFIFKLAAINEPIIEENTWNDRIWGTYNGKGQNLLGNIYEEFKDNILNKKLTMCFTGRRPKDLYGYVREPYIPIVNEVKKDLLMFYLLGYKRFISGGAQGFDQLAFWAVNALKREQPVNIENIVYVPFKGQELIWKETGLFSQKEYNQMLAFADEVVYLVWNTKASPILSNTKGESIGFYKKIDYPEDYYNVPTNNGRVILAMKMINSTDYYYPTIDSSDRQNVSIALYDRNHAMVDDSDCVYGLYPDYGWLIPQNKGGTAECLRYAKYKGKRIFQLSNETLRSGFYEY